VDFVQDSEVSSTSFGELARSRSSQLFENICSFVRLKCEWVYSSLCMPVIQPSLRHFVFLFSWFCLEDEFILL